MKADDADRVSGSPPAASAVRGDTRPGALALAASLVVLAGLAAFHNSFAGPFVFDDRQAIVENLTIRHWWPLSSLLNPPATGAGVCGRPLLNVSFAFNYAMGGTRVGGYHAVNLLLHLGAGLLLLGALRRTLLQPLLRARFAAESLVLSAVVAILWVVHPLQTESVTYIISRSEVLAGVLFLLTLYAFIRGASDRDSPGGTAPRNRRPWMVVSVVACLLGVATKEWMATAPVLVALYDRTFLAGTLPEAWRRRRLYYLALASTWALLALLMLGSRQRNGVVGFGLGVSSWDYALTQCQAIIRYLRLSIWPHPLVFDYGEYLAVSPADAALPGLLLAMLVGGTLYGLWRKSALGFAGAWFFAILAPSSSVVPLISQTMAEHRLYLPLVAVLTVGVLGGYRWLGRGLLPGCLALAVAFAGLAARRNQDYRSEESVWRDVVNKWPGNARAHDSLGLVLAGMTGRTAEAIAQYQEALRLRPNYAQAHYNLGLTLAQVPGRLNEAITHYQEALRLEPELAEAHNNLGAAWAQTPGHAGDAIAEYEAALRLYPGYAEAHNNLGLVFWKLPGRRNEAVAAFQNALRLRPDYPEAHNNLANVWAQMPGRLDTAIVEYETALRLKPDYAEAHNNLASALSQVPGRSAEAVTHLEAALRLRPDYAEAHNNLGGIWAEMPGRIADAIAQYEAALQLKPDYAEAHYNLGLALSQSPGRATDAREQFEQALRAKPDLAPAWHSLGTVNYRLGNLPAAAAAFRQEVRLDPNNASARQALALVLKELGQ